MTKIVLGTKKQGGAVAVIEGQDLLAHTIVLGQSGSGKSFFLARLIEEILLRTKARVVVIDPNGDFETFFAPRESSFWAPEDLGKKIRDLHRKLGDNGITSFDSKNTFTDRWKSIIFQLLISGRRGRIPLRDRAYGAPVKLHWKRIPGGIQDFLLEIDPIERPKVFQGIATCYHFADRNFKSYPSGVGLRDLEDIAMLFESRQIATSLTEYSDAMTLTAEDWHRVRMQFRMIRKRFRDILYLDRIKDDPGPHASDLGNYIHRGFVEGNDERPPWQFLSVGLAGAPSEHSLLSTYVALQSVWIEAVRAWRVERKLAMEAVVTSVLPTGEDYGEYDPLDDQGEISSSDLGLDSDPSNIMQPPPDESDTEEGKAKYFLRRPTFVVIDEAHNFVPEESETPLQKRVSDLITTIAAEGRKYGLFLIISTQRPRKIRKGFVAECENLAVLKLQSIIERKHLVENTTLEAGNDDKIAALASGEVLLSGRWIGDTSVISFAPARTFLGGAGITPEAWLD